MKRLEPGAPVTISVRSASLLAGQTGTLERIQGDEAWVCVPGFPPDRIQVHDLEPDHNVQEAT